jgi:hypothetical protein
MKKDKLIDSISELLVSMKDEHNIKSDLEIRSLATLVSTVAHSPAKIRQMFNIGVMGLIVDIRAAIKDEFNQTLKLIKDEEKKIKAIKDIEKENKVEKDDDDKDPVLN